MLVCVCCCSFFLLFLSAEDGLLAPFSHRFQTLNPCLSCCSLCDLSPPPNQTLAQLLDRLAAIPGLEWVRLHYAYPASFPMDVLQVMKAHDKICNYIDIPLQHISESLLKSMKPMLGSGTASLPLHPKPIYCRLRHGAS